jgi:hypothetical protein
MPAPNIKSTQQLYIYAAGCVVIAEVLTLLDFSVFSTMSTLFGVASMLLIAVASLVTSIRIRHSLGKDDAAKVIASYFATATVAFAVILQSEFRLHVLPAFAGGLNCLALCAVTVWGALVA